MITCSLADVIHCNIQQSYIKNKQTENIVKSEIKVSITFLWELEKQK